MKYFAEPVGETYKSVAPAVFREKVPTLDIKSIPYMQEFRNRDSRLYASILFPLKDGRKRTSPVISIICGIL